MGLVLDKCGAIRQSTTKSSSDNGFGNGKLVFLSGGIAPLDTFIVAVGELASTLTVRSQWDSASSEEFRIICLRVLSNMNTCILPVTGSIVYGWKTLRSTPTSWRPLRNGHFAQRHFAPGYFAQRPLCTGHFAQQPLRNGHSNKSKSKKCKETQNSTQFKKIFLRPSLTLEQRQQESQQESQLWEECKKFREDPKNRGKVKIVGGPPGYPNRKVIIESGNQ